MGEQLNLLVVSHHTTWVLNRVDEVRVLLLKVANDPQSAVEDLGAYLGSFALWLGGLGVSLFEGIHQWRIGITRRGRPD